MHNEHHEDDDANWLCNGCGFKSHPIMPVCEVCSLERRAHPPAVEAEADIGDPLTALFVGESSVRAHFDAARADVAGYKHAQRALALRGVHSTSAAKARAAAVCWALGDAEPMDALLADASVAEVLVALRILDAPRRWRALRARIRRLSRAARLHGRQRVKRRTLTKLQRALREAAEACGGVGVGLVDADAEAEAEAKAEAEAQAPAHEPPAKRGRVGGGALRGVGGPLCKRVRRWALELIKSLVRVSKVTVQTE
eukprot:g6057.t1